MVYFTGVRGYVVSFSQVRNCHRNDVESVLPFLLMSFLYIGINPNHATAVMLFRVRLSVPFAEKL